MTGEFCITLPESHIPYGIKLHMAGITWPNSNYRIDRMEFGAAYNVLEYVVSGSGTIRTEKEILHPTAGDVYIIRNHVHCEYHADRNSPYKKIWFNVSGKILDSILDEYDFHGVTLTKNCELECEFMAALDIVRAARKNSYQDLLPALVGILARVHAKRMALNHDKKLSSDAEKMRERLELGWNEPFSQQSLCEIIHKSPAQMQRIFKQSFGTSPNKFYQEVRLQKAIQFLENTNFTNRHIAIELGFFDEYYFGAWFKKMTGKSPKNYLKQQ